ncbi:Trehalose-6-P synthase/phosphatase complex synthase subunit [Chytridiales sp. JEL 0842]|nr:Trehalose-6-P synthase/phosphatase complex synthase subunit [Chytridiales sp. JEL 0842]
MTVAEINTTLPAQQEPAHGNQIPTPVSPLVSSRRLIVVSNRLPITIKKTSDEGWSYTMSSGGLVSALSGAKLTMNWFGWPGLEVSEEEQEVVKRDLWERHQAVPVFISDEIADMHYNGFSNSILWPLFHYHPGEINFNEDHWEGYQQANLAFADALANVVDDGDLVWIHDYHLMLLPSLLRERLSNKPNVKIGFFLHTPFPSSEIYRILPVRKQVLLGVLQSDLIGFHTYDYARHFLSSCTRILGLHTMPNGVEYEGRNVHVGTFPIGIDPEKFVEGLQLPRIQARIARLEERFKGVKVLVGVDRLDYIKGVPQKLHALELFLTQHPEWVDKVVLVQVAVPSRQDVEEYQHLQTVVNELVGRINGRFGNVEFMPIHFMHKSVNFEELVALYAVADACLVSSTRDGMNLVSYEYIACQQKRHGVLILSEFAGAAQSLNGSIIVNPWNTEELAQAIYDAVTMPTPIRESNHGKLYRYVNKYTAAHWGTTFVRELERVTREYDPSRLPRLPYDAVLRDFRDAKKKKVIFLDYDGTLTTTHRVPEFAKPSKTVLDSVKRLSDKPDVYVYILSGRSREHLDSWFADTGVGLSAEHGCFYRHPAKVGELPNMEVLDEGHILHQGGMSDDELSSDDRQDHVEQVVPMGSTASPAVSGLNVRSSGSTSSLNTTQSNAPSSSSVMSPARTRPPRRSTNGWLALVDQVDGSWRDTIRPLFQHYTERTLGSFIEEKEVNITWHYRNADPEFGSWQAAELQVNLEKILSHMAVSIILGNKTLELRPSMVDKATAARSIMKDLDIPADCGFMLCLGDGKTDEAVFHCLNTEVEGVWTSTVGRKQTEAKYYVDSVKDVENLVGLLAK